MKTRQMIAQAVVDLAEEEIKSRQKEVKYDLRDFTVDYLVRAFREDRFYIPEYQRKFIWSEVHQCRFIESVMLGLPIPMMFVAEMDDGRLEIVDGAQRIQTLERFLNDDLKLKKLEKLPSINSFHYTDFPLSRRRKLDSKALRIVVLEESTSDETRQEIFDRVNTSGLKARASEVRRGAHPGKFMKFVKDCAENELFQSLCPMTDKVRARYEGEELIVRFFAYSDRYKQFRHDVEEFLDDYVKLQSKSFDEKGLRKEFNDMLEFVSRHFPYGFAKTKSATVTPRVRFEAIAIGVNLALRIEPDLRPGNPKAWLDSEEFAKETTTHASNSRTRLKSRVEFVRDKLLSGGGA